MDKPEDRHERTDPRPRICILLALALTLAFSGPAMSLSGKTSSRPPDGGKELLALTLRQAHVAPQSLLVQIDLSYQMLKPEEAPVFQQVPPGKILEAATGRYLGECQPLAQVRHGPMTVRIEAWPELRNPDAPLRVVDPASNQLIGIIFPTGRRWQQSTSPAERTVAYNVPILVRLEASSPMQYELKTPSRIVDLVTGQIIGMTDNFIEDSWKLDPLVVRVIPPGRQGLLESAIVSVATNNVIGHTSSGKKHRHRWKKFNLL